MVYKAPAKRSQPANSTYRNIVGPNMLRAFGHRAAISCDMLGVVGLSLKMVKFEPTCRNTSQHGGQTHATCKSQQCCDMLCWHVAIVWPGLKTDLQQSSRSPKRTPSGPEKRVHRDNLWELKNVVCD